jgi:hypothetical protein
MSRDVNSSMKEKIEALLKSNPNVTQAMAADAIGVSRQRINQVCKRHGIKLTSGHFTPRIQASPSSPMAHHWAGHQWSKLNATTKAAIGETLVAADLMAKGFFVYRCLSQTGPCDLIAYGKSGLLRIEVRCGSVGRDGRLTCALPESGRYDILAIMAPDKTLQYKPELPEA